MSEALWRRWSAGLLFLLAVLLAGVAVQSASAHNSSADKSAKALFSQLKVTSTSLSFAKLNFQKGPTTADKSFAVENSGTEALSVTVGSPATSTFIVIAGAGPATLDAGQSETVTVEFAPAAAVSFSDRIAISSDATKGNAESSVKLKGSAKGTAPAPTPSPSNASSPTGINLAGVSYSTTEQPFLDIFKTGFGNEHSAAPNVGWYTQSGGTFDTNEEQYLQLDANGWVTSLTAVGESGPQTFNAVGVAVLYGINTYPAGNYVVLYQGQGTMNWGGDATVVSSSTGRIILNVATPSSGIYLQITATDPNNTGDYLRNIQLVYSPDSTATNVGVNEAALVSGQIFNPRFLSVLAPFCTLRFKDWMNTDSDPQYTWATRPLPSNAFWDGPNGVPMEIMVDLANQLGTDAWFSMPTYANSTFVSNFATYVHQNLGAHQKVYLEYTNEAWNGSLGPTNGALQALGAAMWPSEPVNFALSMNYYGMQAALNCQAWKIAWGANSARVICVMGNQIGNWGVVQEALQCPYWSEGPCAANYGISAIADAPYFGPPQDIPTSWLSLPDGGQANLCAAFTKGGIDHNSPNGYIADTLAALENDYQYLASNWPGMTIVGYEGGPNLITQNSSIGKLYLNFSGSACVQTVYTSFLNQWKPTGYMQMYNQYNDIRHDSTAQYGVWGALDNLWQNPSTAPKYQALVDFIANNPCWWTGCAAP
jgi:hypothetical protein